MVGRAPRPPQAQPRRQARRLDGCFSGSALLPPRFVRAHSRGSYLSFERVTRSINSRRVPASACELRSYSSCVLPAERSESETRASSASIRRSIASLELAKILTELYRAI